MKKITALVLSVVMLLPAFVFGTAADTAAPSRTINLVYDDSGSMIEDDNNPGIYLDTWCQAKYAMEVFAAMLGEKDTLNIFYMSDYYNSSASKEPGLTLTGSKDAAVTEANVRSVHDKITEALGTPYASVEDAYSRLVKTDSDEKWLVVLTDGAFAGKSDSDIAADFERFTSDGSVKVMMLSMGPAAAQIKSDEAKGIFTHKAADSSDILSKLTGICNQIFQNNELPLVEMSADVSVPMSQLIVFAQGKDVKIEAINSSDGATYKPSSNVKVMYSTSAATNYDDSVVKVSDTLTGYVASFDTYFAPGKYTFRVSGADSINVYYKPYVTIAAYLYDGEGTEVTAEEHLVSGTYTVQYGFLDAKTGEKVENTSLLGKIEYTSTMKNTDPAGNENIMEVTAGEKVTITEGSLEINVSALFLDYNTVKTQLYYDIFVRSDLKFTFEESPVYNLGLDGFSDSDKPMVLKVMKNDTSGEKELTAEEWELLGNVSVTTKADLGEFRIEKSEEIGKFFIYPTLKDNDPLKTATEDAEILVEGGFVKGMSSAQGKLTDKVKITTSITAKDRFMDWLQKNWLKLVISLAVLILVLGYIPPFKKYLPRKIKRRPLIECSAEKLGLRDTEAHGKYEKSLVSTLIPYKPETGKIVFSPSPHKKSMSVRAAGGNGMLIMDTKKFAGKSEITFNGMPVEEDRVKPMRISGNSAISLSTPEYTYTCYLNR